MRLSRRVFEALRGMEKRYIPFEFERSISEEKLASMGDDDGFEVTDAWIHPQHARQGSPRPFPCLVRAKVCNRKDETDTLYVDIPPSIYRDLGAKPEEALPVLAFDLPCCGDGEWGNETKTRAMMKVREALQGIKFTLVEAEAYFA